MGNKGALTVIGLGPMGQAMVRTYLGRGYRVTVWNRTAARAAGVVAEGAVLAGSVGEALRASELVILSLTDHAAMYQILEQATGDLAGRTVVNLSSDTPEASRAAAEWVIGHGAEYLSGGIQVPEHLVGDPSSQTFYSGPAEVFQRWQPVLAEISGTDWRGEDQALAAVYYQLMMQIFWTSMTAHVQSLAIAEAYGIPAGDYLDYARAAFGIAPIFLDETTGEVAARSYPGHGAAMAMNHASAEHVLHTARTAGVDTTLPEAVESVFRRTVEAGHARDSFASTFEVLRRG
ncbi:3-hydroxyisobutyrate dehydrogenase-like beta-hydroxyacid dehydrogenase [Crossiella equi]|uniref:3-hydroxyisobutyrate dehydrogenase-like beta-hydroxyacid dehydrogenase n=1 Tax=Crossiella equi TaxID=130796 RepID=A0ABS5A9V5_9PSEU|nr:NAD(P)-binding domain-containing protein [Crossiella equi]MBP2473370.1 3-hydroxyisobutyrate dehydrogenase-like beta-hydroxyacid dehydrogenase [Crossiella equi]